MKKKVFKLNLLLLSKITFMCIYMTSTVVYCQSFTNASGDNKFSNLLNWNTSIIPTSTQTATINTNGINKAVLDTEVTSIGSIRVGSGGTGELDLNQNGLLITSSASSISYIGINFGVGVVNQNSGTAIIGNSLFIGQNGTGQWNLNGGVLKVSRGYLSLGLNGSSGAVKVKGGGLQTRTGVVINNGGEFIVEGSESHFISIGSNSTLDGYWNQLSGGKITFRLDDRGVTPIEVRNVDGTGSKGNVTFESGSVLDVGFLSGVDVSGSWDVMTWEGTLTNNGLSLASTIDKTKWSFSFVDKNGDGNLDALRLTYKDNGKTSAKGVPYNWYNTYYTGLSTPTEYNSKDLEDSDGDGLVNYLEYFAKTDPLDNGIVSDLTSVKKYMNYDGVKIKLSAGTYKVTKEDIHNYIYKIHPEKYSFSPFFAFKGSNCTYDFTGVKIEMPTYYYAYQGFNGSIFSGLIVINIIGNNNYIKGLTWEDLDDEYNGKNTHSVQGNLVIDGISNTIENFTITNRSSFPYGYGSYFGVGGPWTINPVKHSGVLIRGISNKLLNSKVYSRAFGHGIFIQGATKPIIDGCYVEGKIRTTDDMLSETEGPAFDVGFITSYDGAKLEPGLMSSLSEDGIRVYKEGLDYETGTTNVAVTSDVTISNCKIKHMRSGVTIPFSTGNNNVVSNCTSIGAQLGGFIPGSNNVFTKCTADAVYGPALLYFYNNINNSVVDVDIISRDKSEYYGNDIIAYIAGSSNNITLNEVSTACSEHTFGKVMVSGNNEMFYFSASSDKQDVAAKNNITNNNTQFPVYLGSQASSNTINSATTYFDNGTSNSKNSINLPVSSCCSSTNQDAYTKIEAENYCDADGINIGISNIIGGHITSIEETNWALYGGVDFGSKSPTGIQISAGSKYDGGYIDVYLDELYGEKLTTINISKTGDWQNYTTILSGISSAITGIHDIYLSFQGTSNTYLYNIDYFIFLDKPCLTLAVTTNRPITCTREGGIAVTNNTDYTYLWNTGATTRNITTNTPGTYTVTATNTTNGCTNSLTANLVDNRVTPTLALTTNSPITCTTTGGLAVTDNSNYTYLWNTGATTRSITPNTAGNYSVTVTDSLSCTNSINATLVDNSESSEINGSSTIEAEDFCGMYGIQKSLISGTNYTVSYINTDDYIRFPKINFGSISAIKFSALVSSNTAGGNIEVRLGSKTGTLIGTLTVSNTGSLSNYQSFNTTITPITGINDIYLVFKGDTGYLFNIDSFTFSDIALSISDLSDKSFNLYPSFFENQVTIELPFNLQNGCKIEISDLNGRVLFQNEIKQSGKLDLPNLSQGVYNFKIESENGVEIHKMIKQ